MLDPVGGTAFFFDGLVALDGFGVMAKAFVDESSACQLVESFHRLGVEAVVGPAVIIKSGLGDQQFAGQKKSKLLPLYHIERFIFDAIDF